MLNSLFSLIRRLPLGFTLLYLLLPIGVQAQNDFQFHKISEHCWLYTTWRDLGNTKFPANGMVVIHQHQALIVDTPWDTTHFQTLLDSLSNYQATPLAIVSTHFHDDRTAGLNFYRLKGIPTFSSVLTRQLCIEKGEPVAQHTFKSDTTFVVGNVKVHTFFPGAGHAPDNEVIYVENDKVMFGGCLIKSYEANNLGNLSDADLSSWPGSLQKLTDRFGEAKIIVPGHQGWQQPTSIRHSLLLLRSRPAEK